MCRDAVDDALRWSFNGMRTISAAFRLWLSSSTADWMYNSDYSHQQTSNKFAPHATISVIRSAICNCSPDILRIIRMARKHPAILLPESQGLFLEGFRTRLRLSDSLVTFWTANRSLRAGHGRHRPACM
jgi:hypothetical protein